MPKFVHPRTGTCRVCGHQWVTTKPGAVSKFCSDRCRNDHHHGLARDKRRKAKQSVGAPLTGDILTCALPGCERVFVRPPNRRIYCSPECLYWASRKIGPAAPDGTWTFPCPDCAVPTKSHIARPRRCRECRVAHDRAKDKRKGANLLTVHEIAERDGARCHICHKLVDMALSGNHRMGPTVEHIICRTWDGFDPSYQHNEVLAHRSCNVKRSNTKPSQMVLALT